MNKRIEERTCIFGAAVMLKHLTDLSNEISGVEAADDIEFIHRMRVASRRLRSTFSYFDRCFRQKKVVVWQEQIRQVTKSLGAARDLDVQIESLTRAQQSIDKNQFRPGIHRLQLRLKQRRENIQPKVVLSMNNLKNSGTLEDMHTNLSEYAAKEDGTQPFTLQLYQLAYKAISDNLINLHVHEHLIHNPQEIEALHAMRIDAKHLRYTLEIFSPLYADRSDEFIKLVKSVQEILGDIHDCDVWIGFMPVFIEKEREKTKKYYGHEGPFNLLLPGMNHFMDSQIKQREKRYIEFIDHWVTWKDQGIWENLDQMIKQPVSFNTEVYTLPIPNAYKEQPPEDETCEQQ